MQSYLEEKGNDWLDKILFNEIKNLKHSINLEFVHLLEKSISLEQECIFNSLSVLIYHISFWSDWDSGVGI